MIKLCDSKRCTGCSACASSCQLKAIDMLEDDFGFLYPKINPEKCVGCHRCKQACPELQNVPQYKSRNSFAAIAVSEHIHEKSTSGGVATALASCFLSDNGVVYGHCLDSNLDFRCVRITSEDQLYLIQGTKYVQSDMNDIISQIKKDLLDGLKVLFIGTPCQVAGIINATNSLKNKPLTVSFICGGVPSTKFLKEHMQVYRDGKWERLEFRNNEEYGLFGYTQNKLTFKEDRWSSSFFWGFDEHAIQRESCYHCRYAEEERIGDITIGDFWGLEKGCFSNEKQNKGVSLVIITSEHGEQILENCVRMGQMEIVQHKICDAQIYNPRLLSPVPKTDDVEAFRKKYLSVGFDSALKDLYVKKYRIYRMKRMLKKVKILDSIYHILKKGKKNDT